MADLLAPGVTFAGYEIEGIAGRGGMGVVYAARQLRPSRRVALKVITPDLAFDPDFRRRFERESETAAAIEHPNVVPVYEVGEVDGALFIAMRFVEGTDLRALLRDGGALDPALAANLVTQVGSALDAAHEHGLVHRDVKPANVLIAGRDGAWHPYLTDFGLTKNITAESGVTTSGMFVGTLDYIAPEQLLGGAIDARADVYALGCVLYESLTGRVPFPRDSVVALMYAHGNEPPPSALAVRPDLPREFDDVIERAMAKNPDHRYPSAGDLGRAASAAAQCQPAAAHERSVATGSAAPTAVAATAAHPAAAATAPGSAPVTAQAQSPAPATQPPGGGAKPSRIGLIAVAAAIVVALIVVLAIALGSGGGGGGGGNDKSTAQQSGAGTGTARQSKSKAKYDAQAAGIIGGVDTSLAEQQLAAGLPRRPRVRTRVSSNLAATQTELSAAADQLAGLKPPADATAAHKGVTAVLRSLARSLGQARAATDAGNPAAFRAAAVRYRAARTEGDKVRAKFERLGYRRLGGIGQASP